MTVAQVLIVLALVIFLVAAMGIATPIPSLTALGLALYMLSHLVK